MAILLLAHLGKSVKAAALVLNFLELPGLTPEVHTQLLPTGVSGTFVADDGVQSTVAIVFQTTGFIFYTLSTWAALMRMAQRPEKVVLIRA